MRATCWHCGYQPAGGLTSRYCSDRCKKRGQRGQPYTGSRKKWVPLHPVTEPDVHGHCACGQPLHRKGQTSCSAACRARRSERPLPINLHAVETLEEAQVWDERVALYTAKGKANPAARAWKAQEWERAHPDRKRKRITKVSTGPLGLDALADDVALDKLVGRHITWTVTLGDELVPQSATVDSRARIVATASGRRYIDYVDRGAGFRSTYLDAVESIR